MKRKADPNPAQQPQQAQQPPQQADQHAAQPQQQPGGDPALQGEGNYTAARRHRESLKEFIDSGRVEPAAEHAAPETPQQAREMAEAEKLGRAHAKR